MDPIDRTPAPAGRGPSLAAPGASSSLAIHTEQAPAVIQPLLTVAVLDDEDDAAASICQCLALHRWLALPFTESSDLLRALASKTVDAFVLDWSLSSGTSQGLIQRLRGDLALGETPIFVLTGTMSVSGRPLDDALVRAIKTYRLCFRAKPLSCAKLATDLRTAMIHRDTVQSGLAHGV
jgi:FixJ family two-component response regulator